MPPINAANFLEWLKTTPQALANAYKLAKAFYEAQGAVELPPSDPAAGPREFHAGQTHALTTVALSDEQIDALNKGMAEAWVKEKAIEFIKGAITAASIAA